MGTHLRTTTINTSLFVSRRFEFDQRTAEFPRAEHRSGERRELARQHENDRDGVLDDFHWTRSVAHGGF